jgi:RES domain-containing protein
MIHDDSHVCHRCFNDKALINFIRQEGQRGWCDWCGARNVYVIPLYELGYIFRDAVSIFEEGEWNDDSISLLLQDGWQVFSDRIEQVQDDLMQKMTVAILMAGLDPKDYSSGDYPDYKGGFHWKESQLVEHWHEKAESYFEVRQQKKNVRQQWFDSQKANDPYGDLPDLLEVAFEDLSIEYKPGKKLYRARIHMNRSQTKRFDCADMSAPAAIRMRAGRANRPKQRVLYLASDAPTALAEVRAWKGMAVAIGEMEITESLRIVSLLKYKIPESPFFADLLEWKLNLGELFHRLGDEMSAPMIADDDKKLYFSTQFFCDWVRQAGYDGVEYPSAMGPGFNVVLFKPEQANCLDISYVRITGIQHSSEKIGVNESTYEEGPFDYLFQH